MGNALRVRMSGPLAECAPGFREELARSGYRPDPLVKQLQLMAHLSRWLAERDLEPAALDGEQVELFLRERRASHGHLASERGLQVLLRYLRRLGVVPAEGSREARTPAGELLDRFAAYLLVGRGLSPSTVRNYCNHARDFVNYRGRDAGGLALATLDVAALNAFVLRESERVSVASTQAAALALRSFLRFLYVEGLIDRDLGSSVPTVGKWRLASLVKALEPAFVAELLATCDRGSAIGRRDFAMLMLLWRLGLRIGEVAALELGDLDWRAGELMVRGKGSRQERLPLPVDVGEAIVDWIGHGRPDCESRLVFTRARAPHERLHPCSINSVVDRACRRAGLTHITAHQLRHTAATEMLRAGSSLREVGQVLRHRSSEVTSIYAKIDRRALAALVKPWPGVTA